jgi:hypothetical protein
MVNTDGGAGNHWEVLLGSWKTVTEGSDLHSLIRHSSVLVYDL